MDAQPRGETMKTEQIMTTPNHIIDERTRICLRCGLTEEFIRDAAVSPDCEPDTYSMDQDTRETMTCEHPRLDEIEPDFEVHRYGIMPWRRCPDCGLRCGGPLHVTTRGQFAMLADGIKAAGEDLKRSLRK
jgi:hypothetical protein